MYSGLGLGFSLPKKVVYNPTGIHQQHISVLHPHPSSHETSLPPQALRVNLTLPLIVAQHCQPGSPTDGLLVIVQPWEVEPQMFTPPRRGPQAEKVHLQGQTQYIGLPCGPQSKECRLGRFSGPGLSGCIISHVQTMAFPDPQPFWHARILKCFDMVWYLFDRQARCPAYRLELEELCKTFVCSLRASGHAGSKEYRQLRCQSWQGWVLSLQRVAVTDISTHFSGNMSGTELLSLPRNCSPPPQHKAG